MTEAIGAKGEHSETRLLYRSGYYSRAARYSREGNAPFIAMH
jgi:hypothetical protein